jgi:hypothetical protein
MNDVYVVKYDGDVYVAGISHTCDGMTVHSSESLAHAARYTDEERAAGVARTVMAIEGGNAKVVLLKRRAR